MVQLGVSAEGQKPDPVKKPPESCEVPIPPKTQPPVAVRKGRCSKKVVCVSVITVLILLAVGATLLGVFLSRHHKSWKDCFGWGDWDNGDGSHGDWSHGGGSHGHGGGHHGGHGGHGDGDGPGGHGGEDDDGGRGYPGNEGDHFPDGRP
ncbi:glycine-rich cell wall structural protein-like [Acanthaster planci]|uniref:Glycine-rich cell wall structural protein-like n=1 Tax=Acanthaster planci TaxID=133434 RepID=A0A8B7YM20_ACAPL|nr:glycine-rich cell wall structural protein-like [Acanthaster planci]